jgi:hypothetical protein
MVTRRGLALVLPLRAASGTAQAYAMPLRAVSVTAALLRAVSVTAASLRAASVPAQGFAMRQHEASDGAD